MSEKPTEQGHTPGEWRVGHHNMSGERTVQGEYFEICTCHHHCVGSIEKEMEANARLIAQAWTIPALKEALRELHEAVQDGLCNSGTPGFDSKRLDRAMAAAAAALSQARQAQEGNDG